MAQVGAEEKGGPQRQAFLDALRVHGVVSVAAASAGVPRRTVYNWRAADPDFAEEWDGYTEEATDLLEREAVRRAYEGTERPVFQGGVEVGRIREYSDTLLIFLLKAKRPKVFTDHGQAKAAGAIAPATGSGPVTYECVVTTSAGDAPTTSNPSSSTLPSDLSGLASLPSSQAVEPERREPS